MSAPFFASAAACVLGRLASRSPASNDRSGGGAVTAVLETSGLSRKFGGVSAVSDVSLSVNEG